METDNLNIAKILEGNLMELNCGLLSLVAYHWRK